ncbi:MAG: M28 family peptidase [Candidatus Latescibacterota bacterium]|nr:MAG: M28 family peptidase [Candidatus Latescibacterota bacterium]
MKRSLVPMTALLAIALFFGPGSTFAAHPASVWIAPLSDELTLDAARAAGAVPIDRLPDRVLVADDASAASLARAGFPATGPIRIPDGGEVYLARAKGEAGIQAALAEQIGERVPVAVLWAEGKNAILWTEGTLPEWSGPVFGKRLREAPLREPMVDPRRAPGKALATVFPPEIQQMVDQVDSASYMQWIGNLAGSNEVVVAGQPHTFATRYTRAAECDTAERYVYEQFEAMGYDSVEYDPYSFSGTSARNVIATLPGTTTPNRIYILCGHLDGTSQNPYVTAPAANDNASGTAAVLLAAEILKNYAFRSTIKFIAFTGEEQGLIGSSHYAAEAAANGDSILGVVNCDMIAWYQSSYRLIIEGEDPWDWLMQIMNDAAHTYTPLLTRLDYYSWGSDHAPFQDEGFPAFLAIEKEWDLYPCYHKVCDTTEMNKGNFGADVTRACLATIAYLAEPDVATGVAGGVSGAPARLLLFGNEPNPFNPSTTIRFELPAGGAAELAVFDVSGRLVRKLLDGKAAAGRHEVVWDGTDASGGPVPSGVYFCRVNSDGESKTGKMLLLR